MTAPHLTPRQAQILTAAADGRPLSAVADQLGITREQVASHLSRAYQGLDVTWLPRNQRRQAAVRVARRAGLIPGAPVEGGVQPALAPRPGPSGGTGPRTGLDASVSAEQAPHAPVPARAPERHAAGVLCGCGQPETVARVQTADGHVHLGPPMPAPTAEITVEGRPCHEMPGCDGECCEQAPADPLPLDGWTETTLDCQVDAMGPSPVHPDLVRVRIALPPGAGPDIDAEDGTDWAGLAALAQEQRERAEAAEAVLGRVREWIADQPVTAATPFGDGYREALRDIGDLIRPADHDATEETT